MPRANIYIRELNVGAWNSLDNYSDFVNWCLENSLEDYEKSKGIKKNYSSYALPEYKPDPKRMGKADPSIKVNNSDEPRVEPVYE